MKHIERQIELLKQKILNVGALVEEAIANAISALINRDANLAQRVIGDDSVIDQMEVEVEEDCLKTLALYQPVAADLRFVVAILKITLVQVLVVLFGGCGLSAQAKCCLRNKPSDPRPSETSARRHTCRFR